MTPVLAHHALVLALPFALPAVLVTAGVAVMAFLQRNEADEEDLDGV